MTDEYDDIDIDLKPAREIARRTSVLVTTGRRIELEYDFRFGNEQESYAAETDRFDLGSWAQSALSSWLTNSEILLLKSVTGTIDESSLETHAFDSESAVALGWVLGIVDYLSIDAAEPAIVERLRASAPKPWERPDRFDNRIHQRTESEVWDERERWYLVRLRGLLHDADDEAETRAALHDILIDAHRIGLVTQGDDLVVGSVRFDELNDDARANFLGTADAYLRALTWACGLGTSWDDVPLDDL